MPAQQAWRWTTPGTLGEEQPLRPLVSLCLYRIGQEALTNVRKHAGTNSHTRLVLRYQPDSVELEITDDGAGRRSVPDGSSPSADAGHGIAGMRERVDALHGQLTIVSDPTAGFTVRAELPLQPGPGAESEDFRRRPARRSPGFEAMSEPDIRVVLADDQPLMLGGVSAILSDQPGIAVVGTAGDGREALELVSSLRPHVVCRTSRCR